MYTSIYNPYVPQEVFLAHHGIMGQRWGKKNGPPYPLSAGAHSASEKKAGWRKSLAKGAAAVGRGTVKTAKAVGRGAVKTGKVINTVAVRTHIKPRILMSEKEMTDSIARMRLSKQYKRALKGKFINVEEAERNKGKGAISQLMGAIGTQVIIPTTTGLLRYAVAEKLGGKAEGEKVTSLKETIFNSKGGIGFRNDYFYDKNGNPVYREKGKKNGNEPKQEKKKKTEQVSSPEPKPSSPKPVTESKPSPSKPVSESKPSAPTYTTRTQQLNSMDVLNPIIKNRKESKTIISNANQAYNKMWKQGSGFTEADNLKGRHLSNKVSSLNKLVERTFNDGNADQVWKKMKEGKYLPDDETRKFRYGR